MSVMMTSSLVVFAALLAAAAAADPCGKESGMFKNDFQDSADVTYIQGDMDASTTPGQSITFSTTNDLELFGTTGKDYTVYDNGVVKAGTTGAVPDLSGINAGPFAALYNFGVLAPVWYATGDLTSAEVEVQQFLKSDLYNINLVMVSANECKFLRAEHELLAWDHAYHNVTELAIVTWELKNAANTIVSQLVLAYTAAGKTFALMFFEVSAGSVWANGEFVILNAVYNPAGTQAFGGLCTTPTTLAGMSNMRCGNDGVLVFSLSDADKCTDTAVCSSLDEDWDSRQGNCNELITPQTTCYVHGSCRFKESDYSLFTFTFEFEDQLVTYGAWEIVDSSYVRLDSKCVLTATEPSPGHALIEKDIPVSGAFLSDCGITVSGGEYTIYLHNYDFDDGNQVNKRGSVYYEIKCNPSDWVTSLSLGVTIAGDISLTTVPVATPASLAFVLGTMLDYTDGDYREYASGVELGLGKPVFFKITLTPEDPFNAYASQYGIYVEQCDVANNADFDQYKIIFIKNRCRETTIKAFKSETSFVSYDSPDGTPFSVTAGPIYLARWAQFANVYFRCYVYTCANPDYFDDSWCKNSCTGKGANKDESRRKREAGDTATVLTAHVRVSDTPASESMNSCADETMAYTAISVLVLMLIVATVMTGFLMLKLQSRRKKM